MANDDRSAAIADLWRYYDEHAAQARQHETLRATVTSILAAISAAVVALSGVGGLSTADIPAGVVVLVLSVLGVALSIKHYERNRFHTKVLAATRTAIDNLQRNPALEVPRTGDLRKAAKKKHKKEFSVRRRPSGTLSTEPRPEPTPEASPEATSEPPSKVSPWIGVRLHMLWLGLPVCIGIVGVLLIVLSAIGVRR
ncbi:hypothetical protein AB0I00_33260 [Streptomyces sp. NPDC050803]|uniref:hypothetical protein n=1 Tax=unclassified Streptomyces TaxID=2593676 RepID=UPI00341FD59C